MDRNRLRVDDVDGHARGLYAAEFFREALVAEPLAVESKVAGYNQRVRPLARHFAGEGAHELRYARHGLAVRVRDDPHVALAEVRELVREIVRVRRDGEAYFLRGVPRLQARREREGAQKQRRREREEDYALLHVPTSVIILTSRRALVKGESRHGGRLSGYRALSGL